MSRRVWPWIAVAALLVVPYITLLHWLFFYQASNSIASSLDPYLAHFTVPNKPCPSLCSCLHESISTRATTQNDFSHFLSPSSVWNLYEADILNATLRRTEVEDNKDQWAEYRRWMRYLLSQASSRRLLRSVQPSTFPSRDLLQSIQAILHERWKNPQATTRPLQVVVLGGSLTAGHGCQENPIGLPTSGGILQRQVDCAWPSRLESIVNALVGFEMVNVTNLAMAATTSDVGATVVEYDLWPQDILENGGPDVIVSAFATNDALAIVSGDASSQQDVIDKMQSLLRQVQKRQSCTTMPLLMVVDDFNLWPGNLTEWLSFHQDLYTLVEWYHPNAWLIDYHRSFSDFVYASWHDGNVKGKWEWRPRKHYVGGEAHPGMAFHTTMAWTVAYNMLTLAMDTCAADDGKQPEDSTEKFALPRIPKGPRPPLTLDLKTEDIPNLWITETKNRNSKCQAAEGSNSTASLHCAFTWVANRLSDCPTADAIQEKLNPLLLQSKDWRAEGKSYKGKHGWVAQRSNAAFSMRLSNVTADVGVINILSMVSYGEKWEDSRLSMIVRDAAQPEAEPSTFEISGMHEVETSVILPHKFKLPKIYQRGSSLQLDFRLIGGSTFKITGMAFCGE